jgi:hypothetical protein
MRRTLRTAIVPLSLFALSIAHAQTTYLYLCKDAGGRTFTSDRPIPECANRAVKQLDRTGMVRHEIPAPLTPEQKREQKLKEDQAKADALALEEQKQNDRLILARYPKEKDIEGARARALDLVREYIKRDTTDVTALEKTLAQTQAKANAKPKRAGTPSSAVTRKIDDVEQAIQAARKGVQEREAELVQINLKFDETLKRYREIAGDDAAIR